jgi:hypothetical protein
MSQRDQGASTLSVLFFFDVLGFSQRVSELGLEKIYSEYTRLLELVVQRNGPDAMAGYAPADFDGSFERYFSGRNHTTRWAPVAKLGHVGACHFSDTILIWCPYDPLAAGVAVDMAIDFFCRCLHAGIPLRGAASIGDLIMDQERGIYLGEPIIEAARAESAQTWCGFSFGPSFHDYPMLVPGNRILPFTKHIKPHREEHVLGVGIEWTWHWRRLFPDTPLTSVAARYRRPGYAAYWDNTLAFEALAAEEDWRASTLPIYPDG